MTAAAFRLPLVSTASQWITVFWSQWNAAKARRGAANSNDGTLAPRVTNAEASALVRAWRAMSAMTDNRFPLWYQFAAIACGWTVARDKLNVSSAYAAKLYPIDATAELWLALQRIANRLDLLQREDPRIELVAETRADPVWQGEIRRALREDGATATFVIGFGGCKDPKTGKPVAPRGNCRQVSPGVLDCTYTCDPVVITDPVTHAGQSLLTVAGVLLAVWWVFKDKSTRSRRRR